MGKEHRITSTCLPQAFSFFFAAGGDICMFRFEESQLIGLLKTCLSRLFKIFSRRNVCFVVRASAITYSLVFALTAIWTGDRTESWLAASTQGANAPGHIIPQNTSASKQKCSTHRLRFPSPNANSQHCITVCPGFFYLMVWISKKERVRSVLLLGLPHDYKVICFIRLTPRMTS